MPQRKRFLSYLRNYLIISAVLLVFTIAHSSTQTVLAKKRPTETWVEYQTQNLDGLTDFVKPSIPILLGKFGGRIDKKTTATGYFRTEKIKSSWWIVDPEGHPFFSTGVNVVKLGKSEVAVQAFKEKYNEDASIWAKEILDVFASSGLNSLGAWSGYWMFLGKNRMPYTILWNFMLEYMKLHGEELDYFTSLIPVFDKEFETFCNERAKLLGTTASDPYLIGHFSDNELPFPDNALDRFLSLPITSQGYIAALDWYKKQYAGAEPPRDLSQMSDLDRYAFREFMVARYFEVTSRAMRNNDSNHMLLGAKFHTYDVHKQSLFRIAGSFVDVVSVDYYFSWTPDSNLVNQWSEISGKPIIVGEFYAKAMDTGFPNLAGAGWIVQTQKDRGLFYENYVLGLLKNPNIVGWHWFQYMDNDPPDLSVEEAKRDSNKGVVSVRYETYEELLKSIKRVNTLKYDLADFFNR